MIPFAFWSLICINVRAQPNILMTNVNVISMKDSLVEYKKSVLVMNGTIVSVKDVIKVDPNIKVIVIDGEGAYMMPGLFDMHMHFYHDMGLDKKYLNEEIKLAFANGVTTVRIMNGMPEYLELKQNVAAGKCPDPKCLWQARNLLVNGRFMRNWKVKW